ncbi:sulfatase [Halosimplex pelagicum]|uniref:Sulfatase n=2 Tax=Halosimplex pelagicum TaxID=869886 RepID=A0A7D5TJG3_9EURY|nr:sulfatase [Halosimplex pelagicum]
MSESPNVLFLVLDSARRDRVSAYGHDRETTPTLDRLAEEAVVYDNAFAPAPWTLPSHWSMFTGRFPSEHGVTNGFVDEGLQNPDGLDTIAEQFSREGYRTAGFSNNPWVGKLSGLDRGFDEFVEWDLEISRDGDQETRTRDAVYSRLHSLLGRAAGQPQVLLKRRFFTSNLVTRAERLLSDGDDRPKFLFMNLMEAHSPYYPPRDAFQQLGLETPNPVESRLLNVRLLAYVLGKAGLSAANRERVMEFYDASLRFQDQQLARIVETLKREGVFDETLLVVCADHGKTLGEYDRDAVPPHYLRDINTNVPLLVKPPGETELDRVEAPFELTAIPELLTGGDLRAGVPDEGVALVEDHIPHTAAESKTVTRWRTVADESHTFVQSEEGEEYLLRRDEDRFSDDDELKRTYRDRFDERLSELSFESRATDATDGPIEGSVQGQLKDLGYIG